MNKPTIGEYIKKCRTEKGFNLTNLSEAVNISRPYLSQIESGKKPAPSLQILNKIAEVLDVSPYEIGWVAGYYSDLEYMNERQNYEYKKYLDSLSPEELMKMEEEDLEKSSYYYKLEKFKKHKYVEIESFLNSNYEGIYINKHRLTNEEIKMLATLFDGKEKNYPTDSEIENEFNTLRAEHQKRVEASKNNGTLFYIDPDIDYLD